MVEVFHLSTDQTMIAVEKGDEIIQKGDIIEHSITQKKYEIIGIPHLYGTNLRTDIVSFEVKKQ